jgi:hypothetical protein
VARVAATLLANPGAPPRRAYELIGEVPTLNEIVETLGRVLHRPIRYVQITDEQWTEAVKDRLNPYALDHLSHLWRYFRSGIPKGDKGYEITDAVRVVTGRDPLTVEEFFTNNAEALAGRNT